jgi:hypothetical protein
MVNNRKAFLGIRLGLRLPIIAVCGALVLVASANLRNGAVTTSDPCLALDEDGEAHLDYLDSLAISPDPYQQTLRDSLGLARTTADSVFHVTADSTCLSARAALDQAMGQAPQSRPVYVFALGSFFAVIDPEMPLGEWTGIAFFTRDWQYVSSVGK